MTFNKIIIIPTDTVYGIATGIDNTEGVDKIFRIKNRPLNKQIPVLFSDFNHLKDIIEVNDQLIRLGSKHWPGALSIICKTKDTYFNKTNETSLAIRMPNQVELLELLDKTGPLKVTSLNDSGEDPINDLDLIKIKYEKLVDRIYEFDNVNLSNVSSTIVDVRNGDLKIIRQGEIIIK